MTLAAATPSVSYVGNGSSNAFPFPIPVFLPGDFVVTFLNTGVTPNTMQIGILGSDYFVTGLNTAGSPASSNGLITLINNGQAWLSGVNLAVGYSIVIQRIVSVSQLTSIRNQGSYFPEVIENSLDYITMILQQLATISSAGGGGGGGGGSVGAVIIPDIANGHTYKVVSQNGVIGLELFT